MKKLLFALLLLPVSVSAQEALRVDPMMLVALREARAASAQLDLFPGWDFSEAPVLFYRTGVQDVLLNMSLPPEGFVRYTGPSPLRDESIWVRNDSTHFDQDGQNTVTKLGGHHVLTVSDPASELRNSLRTFAGMTPDDQREWLEDWSFLGSPYQMIGTMLHEGFHVHQYEQSDKFADESLIARYPLYDATNGALRELEGLILLAAARQESPPEIALRHFAAVRLARHTALDPELAGYELANEFVEGLAMYVEYRFYQEGASLTPSPEMYLAAGFDGYERLADRFDERLGFAEGLFRGEIAVNNDPFGAGNLRFSLYPMGALAGLLLDRVAPEWTARIFEPAVFQSTLLIETAGLSTADARSALTEAKAHYGYDGILEKKQLYEQEGTAGAQHKLDALLGTDLTLVRIEYGAASQDSPQLSFTPFGVTPLGNGQTLYELVPIGARFGDSSSLSMRIRTPVMVDTRRREIVFAAAVPVDEFVVEDGAIRTEAFELLGGISEVTIEEGAVRLRLK